MPLQKGVQNNVYEFNSFELQKINVQECDVCSRRGVYLYVAHFLYDSMLLVLGPLSCSLDTCA